MARYRFTQVRLFVEGPLAAGATVELDRDRANYLGSVMRLKPGDEILVFNGRDGEWTARIAALTRKAGSLEAGEKLREQTPPAALDYCFAPLKHARLDYMVQKATEMGAGGLRPVLTRHTQVARVNMERVRANVIEACEQCGVIAVPKVFEPVTLKTFVADWLRANPDGRILFCDEGAESLNPLDVLKRLKPAPLALLIGPEGGFSEEERALLQSCDHVVAIPLGPRILRADTAAVAALAVVQAVLGDWRD